MAFLASAYLVDFGARSPPVMGRFEGGRIGGRFESDCAGVSRAAL
jgi:hypothetical protein